MKKLATACLSFVLLPTVTYAIDCGSKNGVSLPCWTDFLGDYEGDESLPFYPYAKRPNGCSMPFSKPGTYDEFRDFLGIKVSFRDACNAHDRCYYTLGSDPNLCNSQFKANLRKACHRGLSGLLPKLHYFWGGGGRLEDASFKCQSRANSIYTATAAFEGHYHPIAQGMQLEYEKRVEDFVKAVSGIRLDIVIPPIVIGPIYPVIW